MDDVSPRTRELIAAYIFHALSDPSTVESDFRAFSRPRYRSQLGFLGRDFVQSDGRYIIRQFHSPGDAWPVHGVIVFGSECEGVVGLVHGGCLAVCFDEIVPMVMLREERLGFTARLSVDYRLKVDCPGALRFECREVRREGRKMWAEGRMCALSEGGGRQDSVLHATCEALLVNSDVKGDPFAVLKKLNARL